MLRDSRDTLFCSCTCEAPRPLSVDGQANGVALTRRCVRRGRGGVRRGGGGQPAPPVRLRPRRPVAAPLAQLPGAAAGATRARHADVRAPRGGAVQAGAGLHGRRLPAPRQPRPQSVAGAPRRLPRAALRALRARPAAALLARPPPPRRRVSLVH